ncbi:hypothetical protein AB1Y20_004121 [Prymnesium parvum]|uniref:Plastid lipid-associated protein/fibrillin conserved domain-containing protein n=1 Tax=Prymnesium parvum TaxID=97485 RepID=A0AB34J918_PRYPA
MEARLLLAALAALCVPTAAWHAGSLPPRPHRAASPRAAPPAAAEEELTLPELQEELLELLDDIPSRGAGASAEDADDVMEIVGELAALNPRPDWAVAPELAGRWRLRYTSSKAFHNNRGLTGYARDIGGVSTPELLMEIRTDYSIVTYVEPLTLEGGSIAAVLGGFAGAKEVKAECVWKASRDVFLVNTQRIVVGDRSWEPADRQDKAIRTMGACEPIFLDQNLFVLRSQIPTIIFVFQRA